MYIVTGAAGFIGFHVTQALLAQDEIVLGLDDLNAYYDVSLKNARLDILKKHKNFRFAKVDLAKLDDVKGALTSTKPTHFVHLAAQAGVRASFIQPQDYSRSNLTAFINMLDVAKNTPTLQHFVYASSSSVYGDAGDGPRTLDAPCNDPISLYAASKRSAELLTMSYTHMHGLPATGLRFFTVYGSWGRPDMAYYRFTDALMQNQPITVYGDGTAARDFTHISDIVAGVLAATKKPIKGHQLFNLGNDHPETVATLIGHLETITQRKAQIVHAPKLLGEVNKTWADISVSKTRLGYTPKIDLKTGLGEFFTWYQTFHTR